MSSPREASAMDALDHIGDALGESGVSLEELIESGREIRGELIEEKYELTEEQWKKEE